MPLLVSQRESPLQGSPHSTLGPSARACRWCERRSAELRDSNGAVTDHLRCTGTRSTGVCGARGDEGGSLGADSGGHRPLGRDAGRGRAAGAGPVGVRADRGPGSLTNPVLAAARLQDQQVPVARSSVGRARDSHCGGRGLGFHWVRHHPPGRSQVRRGSLSGN